jgi:homogentisate phytyltransferase/homogentisate geranylgeranyltransferase
MITFFRFGRAHTLIGTTLSLLALYLMAARHLGTNDWWMFGISLFSCLAANVYITGLNQVTDVEIDRINKPYLPLASGAYSMRTGKAIVGTCLVLAVVSSFLYRPWLTATVLSSLLIGTAYSAEPVRLKKYHFWAAFCIIVVRGLIVNLLLYLHFRTSLWPGSTASEFKPLGDAAQVQGTVWLLTGVIFVFGIIIAWFKDLPDTEGDAEFGIRTLTLVRDREWVYSRGGLLLTVTLFLAAAYAFWVGWVFLGVGLAALLAGYRFVASQLDLDDQASISRFYQGTWVVFFGVYVVFAIWG